MIRQKRSAMQDQYVGELEALDKASQAKGALEDVFAVKAERKRYLDTPILAESNFVDTPQSLRELQDKYLERQEGLAAEVVEKVIERLEQQKTTLTIDGRLDDATRAKGHIDKLRQQYLLDSPVSLRVRPTLHYSFNKLADLKIIDDAGKNPPGSLHGNAGPAAGKTGRGVRFANNGDFVTFGLNELPTRNSAVTLALWFNVKKQPHLQILFFFGHRGAGRNLYVCIAPNASALTIGNYGVVAPADGVGHTPITDGRWHHLALVYDGERLATLYVDGKLEGNARRTFSMTPDGTGSLSHFNPQGDNECFEGTLDEFMVFREALSAAEVKSIHEAMRR